VWSRIADVAELDKLDSMTTEASLDELVALAPQILAGQVKGRVVVRCGT
jgi:acrylyl-CoA reductase (NADPH)